MTEVAIALGSNIGDSRRLFEEALKALESVVYDLRTSSLYRSAPMYLKDQPSFANAAAIGRTELDPLRLLRFLKELEIRLGRRQTAPNGPREIDLDLITYGSLSYTFQKEGRITLIVPHPRASERRFVLLPLFEIEPSLRLQGHGRVAELLAKTESQAEDVTKEGHELLPVRSSG